jgi:hypothetical protein
MFGFINTQPCDAKNQYFNHTGMSFMRNNAYLVVVSQDKLFSYKANKDLGLICKFSLLDDSKSEKPIAELKLERPIHALTLTNGDKLLHVSDAMDNIVATVDTEKLVVMLKQKPAGRLFDSPPALNETPSQTMSYQKN